MNEIYEEKERNEHEEYLRIRTHVYRTAQPGESIIEPPLHPEDDE